jgi:hypothetical protein
MKNPQTRRNKNERLKHFFDRMNKIDRIILITFEISVFIATIVVSENRILKCDDYKLE